MSWCGSARLSVVSLDRTADPLSSVLGVSSTPCLRNPKGVAVVSLLWFERKWFCRSTTKTNEGKEVALLAETLVESSGPGRWL